MTENDALKKSLIRTSISYDVLQYFLFLSADDFLTSLEPFLNDDRPHNASFFVACEGLNSVISAAVMPFELVRDSIIQRRFDMLHMAERIRAIPTPDSSELLERLGAQKSNKEPSSGVSVDLLSANLEEEALASSFEKMSQFMISDEGKQFLADGIRYELNSRLQSENVRSASQELLIQTLNSSWAVFENFSKTFIVDWLNSNPRCAVSVSNTPELKDFFGKQIVDIALIDDHGFDLSRSMGTVLFNERRLDSLSVICTVFKALFSSSTVQSALGEKLWLLNQQRHLFVHKRGIIDDDYLRKTSSNDRKGERLILKSGNIVEHLSAVRDAIGAIGEAAFQVERR